MTIYNQKR